MLRAVLLLSLAIGCGGADDATRSAAADELATPPHLTVGYELEERAKLPSDAPALDKQRRSVHFGNAYWLAWLAWESYETPAKIRTDLTAAKFDGDHTMVFENTCSGGVAAYVPVPGGAVLAFRGTARRWADWAVNLSSTKVPWDGAGTVHAGFLERFQTLWHAAPDCGLNDDLEDLIVDRHGGSAPGGVLYVTGHSMGAALATLTLAELQLEGIAPAALYTYGSPRVGNQDFSYAVADAARDRTPIFRFVNSHDIVPGVPAELNPIEMLFSRYRHVADHDGKNESELEVWMQSQTLEFGTSHPTFSYPDHLDYLQPLEDQARGHGQYH